MRMLRTASRPTAFEPCIPTAVDRPPSGPRIKHDGFRLIARRDGAGVRLITRNGHDFSGRYPAVAAAVDRLPGRTCVIDGKVVIVDEEGRPSSQKSSQRRSCLRSSDGWRS